MALTQNVGVGGLYPTGRSPLVVDFSSTQRAITERLIKREQERIDRDRSEQEKGEKAILEALSFESVLGATDAMQIKHLENLDEFSNKWTELYAENEGKLSTPMLLAMSKDKNKLQANLNNMKTNVKKLEMVQQEFRNDPYGQKWDPTEFRNAVDRGEMNNPDFDWSTTLIPRELSVMEILSSPQMGQYVKSVRDRASVGITPRADGVLEQTSSNTPILDEEFRSFIESPIGKRFVKPDGSNLQQVRDEWNAIMKVEKKQETFSPAIVREQRLTAAAEAKANQVPGLNEKSPYYNNMVTANERLTRIYNLDERGLNALRGKEIKADDGSKITVNNSDFYDISFNKDGGVNLQLLGTSTSGGKTLKKWKTIVIDPNMTPEDKKNWMIQQWELSPDAISDGKQIPVDLSRYLSPDFKVDGISMARIPALDIIKDRIVNPSRDEELYTDAREVASFVRDTFDGLVKTEGAGYINRRNKLTVDGQPYDLRKKQSRIELGDYLTTKVNELMRNAMTPVDMGEEAPTETFDDEVEDAISKLMEGAKMSREEAIQYLEDALTEEE